MVLNRLCSTTRNLGKMPNEFPSDSSHSARCRTPSKENAIGSTPIATTPFMAQCQLFSGKLVRAGTIPDNCEETCPGWHDAKRRTSKLARVGVIPAPWLVQIGKMPTDCQTIKRRAPARRASVICFSANKAQSTFQVYFCENIKVNTLTQNHTNLVQPLGNKISTFDFNIGVPSKVELRTAGYARCRCRGGDDKRKLPCSNRDQNVSGKDERRLSLPTSYTSPWARSKVTGRTHHWNPRMEVERASWRTHEKDPWKLLILKHSRPTWA